jgi:hypothetical protein
MPMYVAVPCFLFQKAVGLHCMSSATFSSSTHATSKTNKPNDVELRALKIPKMDTIRFELSTLLHRFPKRTIRICNIFVETSSSVQSKSETRHDDDNLVDRKKKVTKSLYVLSSDSPEIWKESSYDFLQIILAMRMTSKKTKKRVLRTRKTGVLQ